MWQIVRKQTRPDTSVQFFSMQTAQWKKNSRYTGKQHTL